MLLIFFRCYFVFTFYVVYLIIYKEKLNGWWGYLLVVGLPPGGWWGMSSGGGWWLPPGGWWLPPGGWWGCLLVAGGAASWWWGYLLVVGLPPGGGLIFPTDPRQEGRRESFQGGGSLAAREWFPGFLSDMYYSNYQLFTFPFRAIQNKRQLSVTPYLSII